MKATTSVSTTFAATHDRHRVGLLVNLTGEVATTRPPINVALVLDKSGSMSGAPLAHAREAALRFASFLSAEDRLTVVAFDDEVRLLFGPGAGNDAEAQHAIRRIGEGGSTNLSGGWLEGHRQVSQALVQGTNRVLLLTDGQANRGIVEVAALRDMIGGSAEHGVSTSCIGFGPHFNEELLRTMSESGGGHFWYVESVDQMTGAFEGEVEGLVSLAAQNVVVEVTLSHPGVAGVSLIPECPVERTPAGAWRIRLGDLYAVQPRSLGFIFHVENASELIDVKLGQVQIRADIIRPDGIEHQTILLPVMATLDGQDHVVPEVETTFLRFAAAQARDEAIRLADAGRIQEAERTLREAAAGFDAHTDDPTMAETRDDLVAEADRLSHNIYRTEDKKYHMARSAMVRDGRGNQEQKLSRRRKP
jgi:Ca-activated chloride channel family protein